MHTRGGDAVTSIISIIFLIIQQLGVNYFSYTTVATPQDIDQIIYFKGFVQFLYLNRFCE